MTNKKGWIDIAQDAWLCVDLAMLIYYYAFGCLVVSESETWIVRGNTEAVGIDSSALSYLG